jgi:hypothetical protein
MALLGGSSLGRGSVDRLAQFLNRRWSVVVMEVQRDRGGASLSGGSLVPWCSGDPSRWRCNRGGVVALTGPATTRRSAGVAASSRVEQHPTVWRQRAQRDGLAAGS